MTGSPIRTYHEPPPLSVAAGGTLSPIAVSPRDEMRIKCCEDTDTALVDLTDREVSETRDLGEDLSRGSHHEGQRRRSADRREEHEGKYAAGAC